MRTVGQKTVLNKYATIVYPVATAIPSWSYGCTKLELRLCQVRVTAIPVPTVVGATAISS